VNDSCKYVLIRGRRIAYEITGSGPALFCLHGLNQNRTIFFSHKIQSALEGYQQVLIDLPGYGESDFIEDCCVEDVAIIIEEIKNKENIASVSLFGYCLGSVFTLDYAIRYPNAVVNLVLMECMIYMPLIIRMLTTPAFKALYDFFFKRIAKVRLAVSLLNYLKIFTPHQLKSFNKVWDKDVNNHYIHMMLRYEKINHSERAKAVIARVLIIVAEKTYRKVSITAKHLKQSIPDAEVLCPKGTRHFIYLDA